MTDVAGSVGNPGDLALALAIAEGLTYAEAGVRCDVSERTVQRRMGDPAFRQLVGEAERERWGVALRKLSAKSATFADTLIELTDEEYAAKPGANVRLRAAMAGLSLRHEIAETTELEARLAAIEEQLGVVVRGGWRRAAA